MGHPQARGIGAHREYTASCIVAAVSILPFTPYPSTTYFSDPENARRFFDLGIADVALPASLSLLDVGGGSGLLASVVRDRLQATGHDVRAFVNDLNVGALKGAVARGFETLSGDACCMPLPRADVIISRCVLHELPVGQHRAFLSRLKTSLASGGWLVVQLHSGEDAACALATELLQHPSLAAHRSAACSFLSVDAAAAALQAAGFRSVDVRGSAAPVRWNLAARWQAAHWEEAEAAEHETPTRRQEVATKLRADYAAFRADVDVTILRSGDVPLGIERDAAGVPVIVFDEVILRAQA